MIIKHLFRPIIFLLVVLLLIAPAAAQKKAAKKEKPVINEKKAVLWEKVNIRERDLFYGPGGKQMLPNLKNITFLKEEKEGHNKKYRIKDGSGRIWVAKLGR